MVSVLDGLLSLRASKCKNFNVAPDPYPLFEMEELSLSGPRQL